MLYRPTLDETKKYVLSGKGGLCYTMNVFMKYLLEALGYNVSFVSGDIVNPNDHILIIVVNLAKPGDRFLVDAGIGYPIFDPIPLDFEKESCTYTRSFIEYKYIWEDGKLNFYLKKKGPNLLLWNVLRKVCEIDLTPRELSFFDSHFDAVYTDVERTPFHVSIRAIMYKEQGMKAVCVKDSSLLLEDDNHCMVETKIDSADEMLKIIKQNYPSLKEDALKAIEHLAMFT